MMQVTISSNMMKYKIADLIAEVPTSGGLASRCEDYVYDGEGCADITIRTELYRKEIYNSSVSEDIVAYMESARQFYHQLVDFEGFYLHSSAVELNGKVYLFSGPCRAGKSTHTRLWQTVFGEKARIINDDKPALRRVDGVWYAYGTPWCGKDGININDKAPVAGVCFMKKASENKIRRLDQVEAMRKVLMQTIHKFDDKERLTKLFQSLDLFLREIPVYELENVPEPSAALLSYETMHAGVSHKENRLDP